MTERGKIIIGCLLLIPSFYLHVLGLQFMWEWYFVDVFGLPILSKPQLLGASALLAYIGNVKYDEDKEFLQVVMEALLRPAMLMTFGWLLFQFV